MDLYIKYYIYRIIYIYNIIDTSDIAFLFLLILSSEPCDDIIIASMGGYNTRVLLLVLVLYRSGVILILDFGF